MKEYDSDDVEVTIGEGRYSYLISPEELQKLDPDSRIVMELFGVKFVHSVDEWKDL